MTVRHIIGVNNFNYRSYRHAHKIGGHNGAYYYAKEIEENIIPLVKTDRHWDLLGMKMTNHFDHSLIFIHHCREMDRVYPWLKKYNDIVLVVSQQHVYDWAIENGYKAILLPLSIDVKYVEQFKTEKTKDSCYVGNRWAFKKADEEANIPDDVDFQPPNMPREELLKFIAPYRKCYAIGRCALEAKVLGCEIMPWYFRYPDPEHWKVLDNSDAAKILQEELDKLDLNYEY